MKDEEIGMEKRELSVPETVQIWVVLARRSYLALTITIGTAYRDPHAALRWY